MSAASEGSLSAPAEASIVHAASRFSTATSTKHVSQLRSTKAAHWNLILLMIIFTVYYGLRMGCVVVLPMACKDLLFTELGDYSVLYQIPMAIWMCLDVFLSIANAMLMERYGRRVGFVLGSSVCLLGSLSAFVVLRFLDQQPWTAFTLLNVLVALISTIGAGEFVRYAAAEAIQDETGQEMMVSYSLSGAAIASAMGPASASVASMFDTASPLHGYGLYFLFAAGFCLISIAAASALRLPRRAPDDGSKPASSSHICSILRRRKVWTAIVAQVGVQFSMAVPMIALPLEMHRAIPSLHEADWLISGCVIVHIVGMFATGVITTYFKVAERLGLNVAMGSGLIVQGIGLGLNLLGPSILNFYVALWLIGVGWNVSFIAGSLLLLRSHSNAERMMVSAANESLRFSANAVASLLSSSLPWHTLNIICLVAVTVVASVITVQEVLSNTSSKAISRVAQTHVQASETQENL